MKKYKLKEEAKRFLTNKLNVHIGEVVQTLEDWEKVNFCIEALEEVPQRIELVFCENKVGTKKVYLGKKSFDVFKFTPQEKNLMEKAINGELLDIDSLDNEDFALWYLNHIKLVDSKAVVHNIKAVLKEYLKK